MGAAPYFKGFQRHLISESLGSIFLTETGIPTGEYTRTIFRGRSRFWWATIRLTHFQSFCLSLLTDIEKYRLRKLFASIYCIPAADDTLIFIPGTVLQICLP